MTAEHENVVQFPRRQIEEIDGQVIDIGGMCYEELQLLEVQCSQRFTEAHTDLVIVRDTIARLYPGGSAS